MSCRYTTCKSTKYCSYVCYCAHIFFLCRQQLLFPLYLNSLRVQKVLLCTKASTGTGALSLSLSPSLSLDRIVQRRQQATVPTIQFDITNSMGMTESCCKQWWLCAASKSHFPIDSIPPTPMLNCLKRLFIAHHALVIMAISQQSEAS